MLLLKLMSLFFVFALVTNVPLDCDFWCKNGMNVSGTSCKCSTFIEPENKYKAVIDQDSAIYYEPTDDTVLPTIEKSFYIPNPVHKIYKKDNFRSSPVNYPAVHRVMKSISDLDNEQSKENKDDDNDLYLDIDLAKDLGRANDIKQHYDISKMQINLMDCLSLQSYFEGKEHQVPSYVNIPTTIDIISKEGKEFLKSKCNYVDNIFASAVQDVYDSYPKKSKSVSETPSQNKFEYLHTTSDDDIDLHDTINSGIFKRTETDNNDNEKISTDLFTAPSTQVENRVKFTHLYESTTVMSPLLDDTPIILIKGEDYDSFENNDVITSQSDNQKLEDIEDDIKTPKSDFKFIPNYENDHTDQDAFLNSLEIKAVSSDISSDVHLIGDTTTISTENVTISETPKIKTENYTLDAISTSATTTSNLENETEKKSSGETFTFRVENDSTSDTSSFSNNDSTGVIPTTHVEKETVLHSITMYDADEPTLNQNNSTDIVSTEDSSILTNVAMSDVTLDIYESETTDQIKEEEKTDLSESFDQTGQEINEIDLETQESNKKPVWVSNKEEEGESNTRKEEVDNVQTVNDTETTNYSKLNDLEDNAFDMLFKRAIDAAKEKMCLEVSEREQDEFKGFMYMIINNKQIPVKFIQGSNGEIRIAINGLSLCQQLFDIK